MSETDDPLPQPGPEPPAERPRRAYTILGRLARAVREQNWFAVALELGIVVLGVVIGFQVTAWGQGRVDQKKEQTYLRQLSRDLAETERKAEVNRQTMVPYVLAPRRLTQAHYLPEPPPRDSIIQWARHSVTWFDVSPVLGTAEALVSTGDIGLIRDDSLRTAIIAYLEQSRENIRGYDRFADIQVEHAGGFAKTAPFALILAESVDPAALDSLDLEGDWRAMVPPNVPLPPLNTDAIVQDVEIHNQMFMIYTAKDNMGYYREEFRKDAAALREQVEAYIER